jgi:hypothetical protein
MNTAGNKVSFEYVSDWVTSNFNKFLEKSEDAGIVEYDYLDYNLRARSVPCPPRFLCPTPYQVSLRLNEPT